MELELELVEQDQPSTLGLPVYGSLTVCGVRLGLSLTLAYL